MSKIRVVLSDPDVLVRGMIVSILKEDPEIEIGGVVADLSGATAAAMNVVPDLILLGLDQPGMIGAEALSNFKKSLPECPVIVLTPHTHSGAESAMQAIEIGAVDFITKPKPTDAILFAGDHLRKRLIPMIKASVRMNPLQPALTADVKPRLLDAKLSRDAGRTVGKRVDAIVIGGCTGGAKALSMLLPMLPADFPVPIVISQHMPRLFTSAFAKMLNLRSAISVKEASPGDVLRPGLAFVAPGGMHTTIHRVGGSFRIQIHRGPRVQNSRPSVDVLFSSAAECYGRHVLGIVLSGGGQDGIKGCELVRASGGQILVQDEASSHSWELAGSIVKMKLSDGIISLSELAAEIVKRVQLRRVVAVPKANLSAA